MESGKAIDEATAPAGPKGKDRRSSPRFPCNGFAEGMVFQPDCMFRGEMLDISQGGCFVLTRARMKLPRLAEVDLRFTLNNRPYRTRARVMDFRPGRGVALQFIFANAHAEEMFRELIWTLQAKEPLTGI
jgi:hypothetical protein